MSRHKTRSQKSHPKEKINVQNWVPVAFAFVILIASLSIVLFFKPECSSSTNIPSVVPLPNSSSHESEQNYNEVSPNEAGEKAIKYINENLVQVGNATLVNVSDLGSIYNVTTKYQGNEIPVYVTKDGKYLILGSVLDMSKPLPKPETPSSQNVSIPKSDVPQVDIFIMSYCPYGQQMQSVVLPVYRLFKDKVNITVKFVNYVMHGEKEFWENTRQYCIQKADKDLYWDYVDCFLSSHNATACMEQVGINASQINQCINETVNQYNLMYYLENQSTWLNGRFPRYPIYDEECNELGVRGSPTVFVNGVRYTDQRTPEAFKNFICNAFNNPPAECSETLSQTETASTGGCGG